MATLSPSSCSDATLAALSSGRTPANTRSMPSWAATDSATASRVSGDHHHFDAQLVQRVDGLPGLLAHLVGQRQRADDDGGSVDR